MIETLVVLSVFAMFGVFWWWLDRQLVRRHKEWTDAP